MKPIAAAVAGALISGVTMYTVGARTATVDAFTQTPAAVETPVIESAPALRAVSYSTPLRTPARPAARSARQTVYRASAPVREQVVRDEVQPRRSWSKSALIIGGSAASGAGVGAMVDGKKGAMIGAAIGGGAASIYEATRRR